MVATAVYRREPRLLVCAGCGAVAEASRHETTTTCGECGRAHALPARQPAPPSPDAGSAADATRRARLLEQDGQPLLPPDGLAPLMDAGPEAAPEIFAEWRKARERVAGGDASAEERLYFLTLLANNREPDQRRKQAIFETALDTFGAPRYRQLVTCLLARLAVKGGDLGAAEELLATCDPRSDDLLVDSELRVGQAFVATARRDWRRVHERLGARIEDVPISDPCDAFAAVLRANAHERIGALETATAQLARAMAVAGTPVVERIVKGAAYLDLCPKSMPAALTRVESKRRVLGMGGLARGLARSGITTGWYWVGLVEAAAGVLLLLAAAIGWLPTGMGREHGVISGLVVLSMALPFLLMGRSARRARRELDRLRERGVAGRARVVTTKETGTTINGRPELRMALIVEADGVPPFRINHTDAPTVTMEVKPGTVLPVRFDRDDATVMTIEWGRTDPSAPPPRSRRRLLMPLVPVLVPIAASLGLSLFGTCMGHEDAALERLNACAVAVEHLGSPIERGYLGFGCGSGETDGGSGHASWSMPVVGPRGRGWMSYDGEMHGGTWKFMRASLRVEGATIDVVSCAVSAAVEGPVERSLRGSVASVMGPAPVATGDRCSIQVGEGDGPYGCKAVLVCGRTTLYGAGKGGYAPCHVEKMADGKLALVLNDADMTPDGGDAALELDERKGQVLLSDSVPSMWAVSIRLDGAPSAEAPPAPAPAP